MGLRRSYSNRDKAEALALLGANGGNVLRTAREAGLPHKTVDDWSKGKGITGEVRKMSEAPEVKGELREKFKKLAHMALDAITPDKLQKASARDLAVIAGIFSDKKELLTGSAEELFAEQMRQHYGAVARRIHAAALEAGQDVSLDDVKRQMVAKYPHLRPHLLSDAAGSLN